MVNFTPTPSLRVAQPRVLMIGPVGAGKSSFFNTMNSVFSGRVSQRAASGGADQSLTTAVCVVIQLYHEISLIRNPSDPKSL